MRAEISKGMNSLSKADIELAINRLRENEKHEFGDSTHYDCVAGAYHFPPKAVIGLALQAKSGKTIYPKDFKGGLESKCFKVLEKNGFHVVRKQNVTWLFQGNPKVFDIDQYLSTNGFKYWSCPKFHKEIQIGDKAFFYKCGKDAAVLAKGVIKEVPTPRDKVKHPELLSDFNKEKKEALKVGVEVEETRVALPEHTISRSDLVADENLKENSLIKSRQSSVFKITENQRKALETLWLKRKTEPRLIKHSQGKILGSRKAFIQSLGATCKNWQWSWSFVNKNEKTVIFGEWKDRPDRKPGLIFSKSWQIRAGRKNKGYRQGLEHINLIKEHGFKLLTFSMTAKESPEGLQGRVRIKDFEAVVYEKKLIEKDDGWYAYPIVEESTGSGENLNNELKDGWSDEELSIAVSGYLGILDAQKKGNKINKTEVYRSLAAKTGRSPKAIEYRMQNISYVLQLSGRSTVKGLAPARHVGIKVIEKLEHALANNEGRIINDKVKFEAEVAFAKEGTQVS